MTLAQILAVFAVPLVALAICGLTIGFSRRSDMG